MSAARRATAPPPIEGLDPVRLLGSGGYADVFLYRDLSLARDVAVKVMLAETLQSEGPEQFTREAHLMAKVSEHPFVVQIFRVGIATDGRPFLAMEYYPGANFMQRCRTERFTVAESLRVGIQVAGAVETAHRAGILHRDLKPANILTSKVGWPGLSDFGIASNVTETEASGMSVPWSPPEVFRGDDVDERADVWSLGATIYTLLAGRSPFEFPGGSNRNLELMDRIERTPVPPVGRDDVPASLERVLGLAMQKDPARRPESAERLGQLLQEVEQGLRLAETQLVLLDAGARTVVRRRDDVDDDATRVRKIVAVDAQPVSDAGSGSALIDRAPGAGSGTTGVAAGAGLRPAVPAAPRLDAPPIEDTVVRPAPLAPSPPPSTKRPATVPLVIGGAVLAAVVVAVVVLAGLGGGSERSSSTTTAPPATLGLADEVVPPPTALTAVRTDASTVTFTWSSGAAQPGDQFLWRRTDLAGAAREFAAEPTVVLRGLAAADRPCLEVAVRRSNGRVSSPVQGCAP